jgi:7-keto-8-aminopelargonate synthetase-like enzyme
VRLFPPGLEQYGLNVAASRLTTGNHKIYTEVEKALAAFFGAPSVTLVSVGYTTNIIVAQALAGNFSHALIDEKSHPSFADAARFLGCPVLEFDHRDPQSLGQAAARCGPGARLLIMTDGLFAQSGLIAPLDQYLKVVPRDSLFIVDDAHGAGVLGKTGRGTLQHLGLGRSRIIQTITLSKAFGSYGGAILGPPTLRRKILQRSPFFLASTPLPLPLANAARRSVALLQADNSFRKRLFRNCAYVKRALTDAGYQLPDGPGPMISLQPSNGASQRLKRQLLNAGIYPPFIKYPGGPDGGYFRFVVSSEHTRKQLDQLISVLAKFAQS